MSDSNGPETSRDTRTAMMALGLVGILLLGAGGMLAFDAGPFGGGSDAPSTATPAEPADDDGSSAADDGSSDADDDGGDGSSAADDEGDGSSDRPARPFTIDTKQIEQCGNTCRDVTVSLTNNGNHARQGITVTTKMYTGGDRIWTGEESVGTLSAEESTIRTARVKIGFVDAAKVKQNGGTVTIETVVRWNGGSETFREQRQVT
jgi:hypothetical protein